LVWILKIINSHETTNKIIFSASEDVLDSMQSFNEDLLWLLRLNHHRLLWFSTNNKSLNFLDTSRFWSQMVYDKTSINSIVCFLQDSLPFYLPICQVTDDQGIVNVYQEIAGNVMKIVCRLITNKENEVGFSEPTPINYCTN
jgi:hypothetical protein